jgi:hypothetical protein
MAEIVLNKDLAQLGCRQQIIDLDGVLAAPGAQTYETEQLISRVCTSSLPVQTVIFQQGMRLQAFYAILSLHKYLVRY